MENERGAAKWHIASVSWGKDSLAMLLLLIEKSWPLDEVVFYDTGMEFQAIYDTQDRMLPELERLGIKYTRLEPENPVPVRYAGKAGTEQTKGRTQRIWLVRRPVPMGNHGETESHRQVCRGAGCGGLYWDCNGRNAALGKKEKAIQAASVGGVGRDGSRRSCPLL